MTLDEMMTRRDLATNTCLGLKGRLYMDKSGVYNMEYFENKSFEEFKEYVTEQFKVGLYNSLIFTGWVTTKGLAHKYVDFLNLEDFPYNVVMLFDLRTFIVFDNEETFIDALKKLGQELILNSSINLTGIYFADNGFEARYNDHVSTYLFEDKPKTIQDIFRDDEQQENNVNS